MSMNNLNKTWGTPSERQGGAGELHPSGLVTSCDTLKMSREEVYAIWRLVPGFDRCYYPVLTVTNRYIITERPSPVPPVNAKRSSLKRSAMYQLA
eukprot:1358573-Amorphochlora_amoeboformis.AAC.1